MNVLKVATDTRTLVGAFLMVLGIMVWAADTRYMQKSEMEQSIQAVEKRNILRDIEDLQVQLGYATDSRVRQMLEARIKIKEAQLKRLEK